MKLLSTLLQRLADLCDPARANINAALRNADHAQAIRREALANGGAELWQHVKTGGLYKILVPRAHAEWKPELVYVVYRNIIDGIVWARPEGEFHDGRFVKLDQNGSIANVGPIRQYAAGVIADEQAALRVGRSFGDEVEKLLRAREAELQAELADARGRRPTRFQRKLRSVGR